MLEGLAAWVLNNYLGKYVENLNTDQLSIALLSGKVELENLPLRKDALRHLGLPVEIKAGFIGKIKLQIPVRQIRSAPWVINIEQLYLVASPLPVHQWDAETEENARQELKLSALDRIEAQWRLETDSKHNNTQTYYSSTYSSWLNFGTGVISDIIENIQLKIQDVHIRYEDTLSIKDKYIVFGTTIDTLSAQSCDANWSPGFCHLDKGGESFKLLEMQKFGIYWEDVGIEEMMSNLSLGDLAVMMSPQSTLKNVKHFILPPVSAHAHVKSNHSEHPLRSVDTPRFACDLVLDDVPITLADWQYDQIVKCVKGLDDISRYRGYRRYKPPFPLKDDPIAWWIYAINCMYPGKPPAVCKPKPTWETCLTMARQNVRYVKIYSKILVTPTIALSLDEKKLKDEVEMEREYEELKVLREVAMKSVILPCVKPTNQSGNSAGRSMLENWFPGWMGWYSSGPNENSTENSSPEAKQLEGEILQVLADSVENNTIFKRDAVFGKFNFTLKRGCVNLCTAMDDSVESSPMLELEFKNLSLNVVSKPRTQAHLVELSLGALYLKDKIARESLFSILVGPPGYERTSVGRCRGPQSPRVSVVSQTDFCPESLFYLAYEKKPQNSICDYRLQIQSKCLDIVYQPNAIKWLVEFLFLPHQKMITQSRIEAMKSRTKKELMKNWDQILGGRMINRTTWDLQFDISAPQIIFVENFYDQNSSVAVIDFGRLQLKNNVENAGGDNDNTISKGSEDEETFVTPCSTPPQSEASDSEDQTLDISSTMEPLPAEFLNETSLHHKIYDRYSVEMTDLQILIGRVKDNWRYAHNKGSSTLHVLDRFNISVQIERRIIHTADPLYPSLTFNANLPKLVAHLNESKINAARNLLHIITTTGLPSPFKNVEIADDLDFDMVNQEDEPSLSVDTSLEMSRLLMVQFLVDHMSLEVQSRGRSVAELQVSGVKVTLMKRSIDMSVTLTVHSLLLVDALQTFGADFELLVASHKHVGMDSMSGSLRDSEPTSPISPASPDPNVSRPITTSAVALSQALNSLTTSPPYFNPMLRTTTVLDAEALITVEVIIITGQEPMQIANVQFNNLDIIANQETIVELMGFTRRVFPKSQKVSGGRPPTIAPSSVRASNDSLSLLEPKIGRTELTFDFHRLNVLLLRGVVKDGVLQGKKICTATMSEAKIQATVSGKVEIEGSLGGLQVLDLTPEGQMHQRIVSVGKDPLLVDEIHPLYAVRMQDVGTETTAFSFKVVRNLESQGDKDVADITVRMASLWYTHSPHFVCELQSCATEFKQYMANLARSIRSAATDMALGLVQARAEALAQSLYMNARLSSSIYGSAFSLSECSSPRKRRRSGSIGASGYSSARDTLPQTPYSPDDIDDVVIDIKLDIVLDSPVVILPRASNSSEVFIAHLGRINVSNRDSKEHTNGYHDDYAESRTEFYEIEIRDMNIYSLDTCSRRTKEIKRETAPMIKLEVLYNCDTLAKPILHDTLLKLNIEREICKGIPMNNSNESILPLDDDELSCDSTWSNILISGAVVTALKLSLTRMQYEQLLDTLQWLTSTPKIVESQTILRSLKPKSALGDISEEDTGVTTLNMDPHVRAKLFPAMTTVSKSNKSIASKMANIKVSFELPIFTIELRGNTPSTEQGLIDVSFREFVFNYEKSHRFETNIQVSLRSIFMEDLLQPEGSKQRAMMISSSGGEPPPNASCLSRSCPNVTDNAYFSNPLHNSLPDHLETSTIFGMANCKTQNIPFSQRNDNLYPCTPPPSPTQGKRNKIEKNLVLISVLLVDKDAPNFNSQYNSLNMSTSVDFNCLDLVISVESWVVLIDFFSASTSNTNLADQISEVPNNVVQDVPTENIETNITVRSLTMVLVKSGVDIARANISKVEIAVKSSGLKKEVGGNLGSMSLLDLTLHGQLYRERFLTSGSQALKFKYIRHSGKETKNYDAHLEIGMASVVYVHTKRFVAELQAFFNHFTQLQRVMEGIRAATSGQKVRNEPFKLALSIYAGSPIILVPVSSKCSDLLVINLGQLLVKNRFKMSSESKHTTHIKTDTSTLLDIMSVELQNMDLYMGTKENDLRSSNYSIIDSFQLGSIRVTRNGPSLLTKKFQVKFIVERNLLNYLPNYRIVPDMSIYGQLSTLDATLDLKQYRLLKGLFTFNLGEDTERILPSISSPITSSFPSATDSWTLSSIKLDLQNVTLRLRENSTSPPLTCINFIKSRLTVETFSNLSQDVDLVSQEILIMDTRFDHSPGAEPPNVFTNILQPVKSSNQDVELVQVEVHSRRRRDHTKFTVLLNNMRLMAVFDWWETLQKFVFQNVDNVAVIESPEHQKLISNNEQIRTKGTFEVKLNITDSEIVVVENTAQWDTHAVILKSTTVMTYKPKNLQKPLSCNLNHCEMFSCILGMEEETALSIIDPITLNIDINGDNKLEAQLQYLTVRLSYHDMKMFLQILNSLPKQMLSGQVERQQRKIYSKEQVNKLSALGFGLEDCILALEKGGNKLDEAAIWLTKYAVPRAENNEKDDMKISIKCVEVKASCISVCIIDDCGDSDVPLLEFSLTDLWLRQNLFENDSIDSLYRKGSICCILASDYYNRVLSGWEPFLEPWNCNITWHKSLSAALLKNRLNVEIRSQDILNVNITSTLLDLYKQVKENWTKDYYNNTNDKAENPNNFKAICQSPTYKQRSPFVPFALKNDTGSILHFSTLISEVDDVEATQSRQPDDSIITVLPGETVPFSFRVRDKMRHQDSHKRKMHQLIVKVDGWQQALPPVSVDKVGVYFRHSIVEIKSRSNMQADIPPARIIFDIALEGSARKLITIRSAVLVRNKLSESVEIKLESQYLGSGWVPSKALTIDSGKTLAIPLQYAHSDIDVRPFGNSKKYTFCQPSISWKQPNSELLYDVMTCSSQKGGSYRFCSNITKEKYIIEGNYKSDQPAHRITLLPTVKIVNLLPIDLIYGIKGDNGRVTAGSSNALTSVDPDDVIELNVLVENFVSSTSVIIPAGCVTDFSCRIRLEDNLNRKLYLQAVISCNREAKIKIVISAPYWIINRTGLPLVFRQAGTSILAAGQFEEHEFARMLLPLLFSFSDHDASPTINARVGNHVVRDGSPQWCSNFHVQKGIQVRKFRVTMTDGRPDTVFVVGIEIRPGRGRYRSTNIITISPRYQVHNRSSYQLVFCQSFFTLTLSDPNLQKTSLRLMPNSHMPFHWPRLDQDQYLCVSIKDIPDCCWSGGLKIDANSSLHVNIRDINGRVYFLRLEIVLQGATFFIVFTDADTMPPPMRVDNFSEVSLTFAQSSSKEVHHSTARAHSSIPYAWDQPTQPPLLTVVAPGGICKTYDMSKLGPGTGLTYENFIYIAFVGTFKGDTLDPLDVENQELVLDVVNETQVVLARKRQGQRSQLWRMTSTGHVQHEGSSPPYHPNQPRSDHVLVLDIEGNAPQPNSYSRLMLRRMDPRRVSTQLWKFTDDGLLCCAHYNMCVQAQDGFYGLRKGNVVVLGMPQKHSRKLTDKGVPIEQAVGRQRLRPGSGFLGVDIIMDGPTRVLVIKDSKEKKLYATSDDREWGSIAVQQRPHLNFQHEEEEEIDKSEFQFTVHLQGLGVSVVCCKTPEELLYGLFSNIVGEIVVVPESKTFSVSVGNVQIDNQLFETSTPVVLYVTPPNVRNSDEGEQELPAILFQAEMQKKVNENAVIFKYLILRLKNISVILEELLLLKFCSFAGLHSQEEELFNKRDENDFETQRLLTKVSTAHSKRYYFGVLQLVPNEIRLSVKTASKLGSHLQKIKRKLGLTLIKFEDAAIDLQAFDRKHPFETWQFLLDSIIKHFRDELMWQAGIILGSVDFLGNPLGFVNDVSEGLSGFFLEGNVSALVKNVTHGISNSAAKVTESLSDGLGKVAMDDRHEETRQRYKCVETGRGRDHIVAGFKGLGFGLLGGATSIFKQVYEGLANDGIQGAFSGMGKGLVGAVTKPVVGVLDLASETARAVRDSSRSKIIFERHRLPRCVHGYGGLLPRYNLKQSQGQQYLYMVNDKNYNEQLIAFEVLGSASEDLQCIVSNERIRIVANNQDLTPIIDCHLINLISCKVYEEKEHSEARYYIEIVQHVAGTTSAILVNPDPVKKPRVRCRSVDLARTVAQQINYAKRLYTEYLYTLHTDNIAIAED